MGEIQHSVGWGFVGVGVFGALEVLGFYRTQDQPDFSWNERDEDVMRRFFPYTGSLLLLLKPLPGLRQARQG